MYLLCVDKLYFNADFYSQQSKQNRAITFNNKALINNKELELMQKQKIFFILYFIFVKECFNIFLIEDFLSLILNVHVITYHILNPNGKNPEEFAFAEYISYQKYINIFLEIFARYFMSIRLNHKTKWIRFIFA